MCHLVIIESYSKDIKKLYLSFCSLEKAYDIVRWVFVKEALEEAGFLSEFENLVMACMY